jgi:Lrp/AsnC family leucine-responsive transcriptional regulator
MVPLLDPDRLLDEAGVEILRALQENARISFAELGRKVGLSAPAISDRVRKMEEVGIIAGYHARVNSALIGNPVTAYARLRVDREYFQRVIALSRDLAVVRECYHAAGDDAFLLKLVASSEKHLEDTLDSFRNLGEVHTQLILATPVQKYSA